MNLVATTNKASYAPGDDISVTLTGGYKPSGWASGWMRVNMYSSTGTPLVDNSAACPHNATSYATGCDFPIVLKTRAIAGMTNLYVGWVGNQYDTAGAKSGTLITSGIGVGKRPASGAPAGHIEEVVLTNSFTVSDSASSSGGGGSLDWAILSGLIGLACLRRKIKPV